MRLPGIRLVNDIGRRMARGVRWAKDNLRPWQLVIVVAVLPWTSCGALLLGWLFHRANKAICSDSVHRA